MESFHGRFRDECLNREQLWTLTEARVVIADYRDEYNQRQPHGRLGYLSPVRFAACWKRCLDCYVDTSDGPRETSVAIKGRRPAMFVYRSADNGRTSSREWPYQSPRLAFSSR